MSLTTIPLDTETRDIVRDCGKKGESYDTLLRRLISEKEKQVSTVYLVTDGEYSDYSIMAAFSDEELATDYQKNFKYDGIEEFCINPSVVPIDEYRVIMCENGDVTNTYQITSDGQEHGFNGYYRDSPDNNVWYMNWVTLTHDKNRAIKVANEKRIQILAHGYWGDSERTRELFER